MALIRRVQVANHLDSSQVPGQWNPDFRLLTLDLKGHSAAIVMLNGSGKTTIANAILLLLTRHRGLAQKVKAGMSPSNISSFSHVRIEIVQPNDEPTGDMFVQQGMDIVGETWVYGACGHKDGDGLSYYYYPGKLEDCPVGYELPNQSITLYTNQEFAIKRSNVSGMKWGAVEEEHLRSLQPHFAVHATRRMLNFHLAGGGDKSADLYPVVRGRGDREDVSLFLNALAPELISGVTGKEGEEGEDSFEKTILISATKYVGAKITSEARKKSLEGLKTSLADARPLRTAAKDLLERKADWDHAKKEADFELIVLKKLVDENVVPGVPRFNEDNGAGLDLRKGIIISPDADEVLILDRALAAIAEVPVRQINEVAEKNEIMAISLRGMVGLPEFGESPPAREKNSKGYSREDAVNILLKNFPRFGSEDAINDMRAKVAGAFDRWASECDTNPFRKMLIVRQKEQSDTELQIKGLENSFEQTKKDIGDLKEQIGVIEKGKAAWEAMKDSSLFSAEDLRAPLEAEIRVSDEYEAAHEALNNHIEKTARLEPLLLSWNSFRSEWPDATDPNIILGELNARKEELSTSVEVTEAAKELAEESALLAQEKEQEAKGAHQEATANNDKFNRLEPEVTIFEAIFGEESPEGLASKVNLDVGNFISRQQDIEKDLSALKGPLEDLVEFRLTYPGEAPELVKAGIETTKQAKLIDRNKVSEKLIDLGDQLSELQTNKTSPRAAAKKVSRLLAELSPVHLLDHLNLLDLAKDRKLELLTLFSNHLFAPVLPTPEAAGTAVEILEKEDIPCPVFVGPALSAFAKTGQMSSSEAGKVVYTHQAGVRSLTVQALFDPKKFEEIKDQIKDQILKLKPVDAELEREIQRLGDEAHQVSKAVDAMAANVEVRSQELQSELDFLRENEETIRTRASHKALKAIEAMVSFLALGGHPGRQEAINTLQNSSSALTDATRQSLLAKEAYSLADQQWKSARTNLSEYKDLHLPPERTKILEKAIEFFEQGGPAFTLTADTVKKDLSSALQKADKKRPFQFNQAAEFIQAGGNAWEYLNKKISDFDAGQARNRKEKEQLVKTLAEIEVASIKLRKLKVIVDRMAAAFIKQYAEKVPSLGDLLDKNFFDLEAMRGKGKTTILMESALVFARNVRENKSISSIQNTANQVADAFEALDSTAKETQKAKRAHDLTQEKYNDEIKRFLNSAPDGLTVHEVDTIRMKKDDDIQYILRLFEALDTKCATEEGYVAKIIESESQTRKDACERLATMAADARSNLKLFRKILAQTPQSTFIVNADVLPEDGIREVMQTILEYIESEERASRERKKTALQMNANDQHPTDDHKQKSLDYIRSWVYRKIFTKIDVKVVHSEMRAGRPFHFGETLSQGQKTAVGLMLMSKLAQFTMERDALRSMSSLSGARRKKALARSQSVMIFDGLFSNLTNRAIINEAMQALKATKGNFQLIGLIHNPYYENDPKVFPSFISIRKLQEPGGVGGFLALDDKLAPVSPADIGRRAGELEPAHFLIEANQEMKTCE